MATFNTLSFDQFAAAFGALEGDWAKVEARGPAWEPPSGSYDCMILGFKISQFIDDDGKIGPVTVRPQYLIYEGSPDVKEKQFLGQGYRLGGDSLGFFKSFLMAVTQVDKAGDTAWAIKALKGISEKRLAVKVEVSFGSYTQKGTGDIKQVIRDKVVKVYGTPQATSEVAV